MHRLLLLTVLVCLNASLGEAQTRTWDSLSGGQWNAPANWTDDNVPDSPAESARFDRFSSFNVVLSSSAPTPINDLRIDRGSVQLFSDGAASADLVASGDTTIAGDLTLTDDLLGVRLQTAGALSLEPGGSLLVEGGEASAASTDLGGNLLAGSALLVARGSSTLDLGNLRVGLGGGGPNRVAVDLFDDSTLRVDDLRIGADAADSFAEVNLAGTNLTQPANETTLVGRSPAPSDSGRGSLTVTDGGVATLGSLVIEESGSVQTAGGRIEVFDLLEVRSGGTYAVQLEPGSSAAELTAGRASLSGVLQVRLSLQATRGFEAGDVFRVLDADAVSGGFDTLDAPDLPAGLAWRTSGDDRGLDLLVVPDTQAGDFNFDGAVNTADYAVWRDALGQRGPAPAADANGDGIVDRLDYDAWVLAFAGPNTTGVSIPEPATLSLLALIAAITSRNKVARPGELF